MLRVADATRDTFDIDATSAGGLFTDAWMRKDDQGRIVEAVFSGANVPKNEFFWNIVTKGTPDNPYSNFLGFWTDAALTAPTGAGWERIYPHSIDRNIQRDKRWSSLIAACPNRYRKIQCYGESAGKEMIAFVSHDCLFIYDDQAKNIRSVTTRKPVPKGINRITLESEGRSTAVVLWVNGLDVGRIRIDKENSGEVIGSVPKSVELKSE